MKRRWLVPALGAALFFGLACGGLPFTAEEAALEELPPESPFTWALLMSWGALTLGGGSAILGIWVDRDRSRPILFGLALSVLIFTALCVGGLQGYLDEDGAIETRANLERMLDMVDDIAAESGDPELAAVVEGQAKRRRARPGAAAAPRAGARRAEPAPSDVPAAEGAAPADGTSADGTAPAEDAAPAEVPVEGAAPAAGKTGKGAKAKGGG